MNATAIYVRSLGLACPVGLNWRAACAAMFAGITRKCELEYRDNRGRPIVGSRLSIIGATSTASERWLFLLAYALRDALRETDRLEDHHLILSLPRDCRGRAVDAGSVAAELSQRLGRPLDPRRIEVVAAGAYGGMAAVAMARSALANRETPACIVAGADSLLGAQQLLRLAERRRLLGEENADGVIPGEAAAALVLTARPRDAVAALLGVGLADEPSSLENDLPLRAAGVAAAARDALAQAGLGLHDMDFRASDAAGESFFFKEQALLVARLLRQRKEEFPLWLVAEALGDCGAAAGLCGLVHAIAGFAFGRAPGPRAIAFAGNDQGRRAAVVIEDMSAAAWLMARAARAS
jgi:3-oxoacyl-[acyl-carrier-protein] synthase I